MRYLAFAVCVVCFFATRLFYGFEIFSTLDQSMAISVLKGMSFVNDAGGISFYDAFTSLENIYTKLGLTFKRFTFVISLGLSIFSGLLGAVYLNQKLKNINYSFLLIFLFGVQPLLVWLSGEPSVIHFGGAIFCSGVMLILLNPWKLRLNEIFGSIFLYLSVFIDNSLYPYLIAFYLLLIFTQKLSKEDKEGNNVLIIGVGLLATVLSMSLLSKPPAFFSTAPKTFVQVFVEIFSFFKSENLLQSLSLLSRGLVKAYFSPIIVILPLFYFFFDKKDKSILVLSILGVVFPLFEINNIKLGQYHHLYSSIYVLLIVCVYVLSQVIKHNSYPAIKIIFSLMIPIVLITGLGARIHRDYYRRQSMEDVGKVLMQRSDSINASMYVPFGQNLPVKDFPMAKAKLNLRLKRIPKIFEHQIRTLLENDNEAFLFIDDYFIHENYWRGSFWRKESIEVEGVSVTLVKKFNENTPNIGRLYKLKKR